MKVIFCFLIISIKLASASNCEITKLWPVDVSKEQARLVESVLTKKGYDLSRLDIDNHKSYTTASDLHYQEEGIVLSISIIKDSVVNYATHCIEEGSLCQGSGCKRQFGPIENRSELRKCRAKHRKKFKMLKAIAKKSNDPYSYLHRFLEKDTFRLSKEEVIIRSEIKLTLADEKYVRPDIYFNDPTYCEKYGCLNRKVKRIKRYSTKPRKIKLQKNGFTNNRVLLSLLNNVPDCK